MILFKIFENSICHPLALKLLKNGFIFSKSCLTFPLLHYGVLRRKIGSNYIHAYPSCVGVLGHKLILKLFFRNLEGFL